MTTKLPPLAVAILLIFSCVHGVFAGNFKTSDSIEHLVNQAKLQLVDDRHNTQEAESLLQQAATQGSEEAHILLGRIYTRHPEKKDFATASYWLEKAADMGSTDAMDMLSVMYLDGRVIKPDHSKAAYWLQRGSDAGDLGATYNLADFYMQGTGVPKDPAMGTRLLKEAAMKGHTYSIDYFVKEAQNNNNEAQQFLKQLHADQSHDTESFKKYRQEAK